MKKMEKQRRRRPITYLLVALVVGGAAAVLASCGGGAPRGERGRAAAQASTADSLAVSLSLNAGSFAVGERIEVEMVARNTTERPLRLTFPTAQRHDFIVRKNGRVVWQWSADMMFAQVLGAETLAPGDSLTFAIEWDQRATDGTQTPLGAYTIQGAVKTVTERATEEKRFGIVD